jgi:hypothetical protein
LTGFFFDSQEFQFFILEQIIVLGAKGEIIKVREFESKFVSLLSDFIFSENWSFCL